MSTKLLIIDGDDQGNFFLMVEDRTLFVGDNPTHAESILTDLRIKRIHCELEVDDDTVVVNRSADDEAADGPSLQGVGQSLLAGSVVHLGHTHVRLEGIPAPAADLPTLLDEAVTLAPDRSAGAEPTALLDDMPELTALAQVPVSAAPSVPKPTSGLRKHLRVIDGSDTGKSFAIPDEGVISIGKSHRHAEIILHDLYVARVHCELHMAGDKLVVTHVEGANGTLVNGKKITEPQELQLGDVVRVGNSHLKLEEGVGEQVPEFDLEVIEEVNEPSPVPSPTQPLLRLENQTLGHYQLGPLLGRGHVGVVFRAEDLKTKQVVALKVLAPEFPAAPAELQHLVQVLKATQALHHANLVGLQGVGRSGASVWMALDFVEGEGLPQLIQRCQEEGQFKWKRAGRLAVHLARALVFLQQHKIVHRNITPANVLIREADKQTILADAVLAQALAGSRLEQLVSQAKRAAELPYLAPEQLEPSGTIDHRTDLYGVGAVLYTLLTGHPPFSGKSAQEIIDQIQKAKPVKPIKTQPTIPTPFEAIVLRLLAKSAEDRYQNAAALLAEVEPIARQHEIKL